MAFKDGGWDTTFLLAVIVAGILLWNHATVSRFAGVIETSVFGPQKPLKNIQYVCAGGKSFQAIFYTGNVHLHLSDGRDFILPQTAEGSTSVYADSDGSLMFVEQGTLGFVEEGPAHAQTYSGCTAGVGNYS